MTMWDAVAIALSCCVVAYTMYVHFKSGCNCCDNDGEWKFEETYCEWLREVDSEGTTNDK